MKQIVNILMFTVACIFLVPILLLCVGSLQSGYELKTAFAPLIQNEDAYMKFHLFPSYPTLMHYVKILFLTPAFFTCMFNSMKLTVGVLWGQLIIAVPSAWAFARFSFRGKRVLFFAYVILMILPFQVTMLSNYLVLNQLGLMNTHWAIILPGAFSTFPVFLMYHGFEQIPVSLLEAASVDGASNWIVFTKIALPLGSSGILSSIILSFLEYWNLCEQPLAFLKDKSLWPLSLYLPELGFSALGTSFAAAVLVLVPAGFVFFMGQDYLEQGIVSSAIKE